ncbi:hypothetical protein [Kribbella endophytica]
MLLGSLQTDILLTLAARDEFQPRWNSEVPAGRKTGEQEKAQTTQAQKPPEREL